MISRKFPQFFLDQAHFRAQAAAAVRAAIGILVLCVSGCAGIAPLPPVIGDEATQAAREAELQLHPNWSFTGRLAVSQGKSGGNARIEWSQNGADFDIRLSAPITRQSWRLRQAGAEATLEGLDGGMRSGADPEALLLEATGWRIPVNSMAAWVRGARAPGMADLSFDDQGRPSTISQDSWAVEYRGWFPGSPGLPSKVFARQDQASVKLSIDAWGQP